MVSSDDDCKGVSQGLAPSPHFRPTPPRAQYTPLLTRRRARRLLGDVGVFLVPTVYDTTAGIETWIRVDGWVGGRETYRERFV